MTYSSLHRSAPQPPVPPCLSCRYPGLIFVFGSNESGIHGAGAAAHAMDAHGAEWGVGEGLTGTSYALPTKNRRIQTLPRAWVAWYVERFVQFAEEHQELKFFVTRVGCGLAGFTDAEIAPLFEDAPVNVVLPDGWSWRERRSCPRDTDGDGNCGRLYCPHCGPWRVG